MWIVYKKTDEWYIEWQRVATSGTTSDNEWQWVTMSENEWYNEWQQVAISANSYVFRIREDSTSNHPKESSLNLKEDLEEKRDIELRAEGSPKEKILTLRSRNCRSSCLQIFLKIVILKIFAIFTGKHLCWSLF